MVAFLCTTKKAVLSTAAVKTNNASNIRDIKCNRTDTIAAAAAATAASEERKYWQSPRRSAPLLLLLPDAPVLFQNPSTSSRKSFFSFKASKAV
jgi:hypothetical protein